MNPRDLEAQSRTTQAMPIICQSGPMKERMPIESCRHRPKSDEWDKWNEWYNNKIYLNRPAEERKKTRYKKKQKMKENNGLAQTNKKHKWRMNKQTKMKQMFRDKMLISQSLSLCWLILDFWVFVVSGAPNGQPRLYLVCGIVYRTAMKWIQL